VLRLLSTFSVLKAEHFEPYWKWKFKISSFDHEAALKAYSASNLEFSQALECSRTHYKRKLPKPFSTKTYSCAPHAPSFIQASRCWKVNTLNLIGSGSSKYPALITKQH